jgi:hypothetical protein
METSLDTVTKYWVVTSEYLYFFSHSSSFFSYSALVDIYQTRFHEGSGLLDFLIEDCISKQHPSWREPRSRVECKWENDIT